jgi:hypothetical protein
MQAFSEIKDLHKIPNEDTLLGRVEVFGVDHHIMFYRVRVNGDGCQVGSNDPHGRLEDLANMNDDYLVTVQVPGHEGDWVVCVFPYGD